MSCLPRRSSASSVWKKVSETDAAYLAPPGSQLFTLSVARAAGEVEAPPSVEPPRACPSPPSLLIPKDVQPILVTDAGFRAPWFRAVEAMSWYWLGRLRHRTLVKPADAPDTPDTWVPCRALYALAVAAPRDLGWMDTERADRKRV